MMGKRERAGWLGSMFECVGGDLSEEFCRTGCGLL